VADDPPDDGDSNADADDPQPVERAPNADGPRKAARTEPSGDDAPTGSGGTRRPDPPIVGAARPDPDEEPRLDLRRAIQPRAILFGLTVLVALAVIVAASTTTAAFGVYNGGWDGAAQLQTVASEAGADARVVVETDAYPTNATAAQGTVALVIAPGERYDDAEAERVRAFVRAGGTLVVAEDYAPYGNALLREVGADVRFDGDPVRDERELYRSPAMPMATNTTDGPLTRGVDRLALNHGTVLRTAGTDARALVRTSEFAYVDRDRDEEIDDNETLAHRPVVAAEPVGDGRVIAVSDPSLFVNAMLEAGDNRPFTRNLLASGTTTQSAPTTADRPSANRVLLDYSHAGAQPPLAVAGLRLRTSTGLQALTGVVGVAAVAGWRYRRRVRTLLASVVG
jgi:hypothetical protein